MAKRKRHSDEFRIEAVRQMLNRGDRTVAEIAHDLGVSQNILFTWRAKYENAVQDPSRYKRETAEQKEIRRLRKDVDRLEKEREILKKATAFFARESR